AAPIYMVTNNLGLSLASIHAVFYFIVVWILHDIAKNLRASTSQFLFSVLLLFTPYSVGQVEWANMLFVGVAQYEFRVIVLLMLLNLILMSLRKETSRRKFVLNLLVYCAVNFWTSLSTGNYVLLMIVSPFVLWVLIRILWGQQF